MKYADEHDVILTADNGTNLNTVSDEVLEGLVKYRFRSICCSIDGASNDTFPIYRVNGRFDRVIENLKKINHYKKVYNSVFPYLNWQFIVFGHNEHEIETARNTANNLNMTFSIKLNYSSFSPIKNYDFVKEVSNSNSVSWNNSLVVLVLLPCNGHHF
jgi:MoaA/NifB/PqqE/SkfB family radical SAM enzyme